MPNGEEILKDQNTKIKSFGDKKQVLFSHLLENLNKASIVKISWKQWKETIFPSIGKIEYVLHGGETNYYSEARFSSSLTLSTGLSKKFGRSSCPEVFCN